MVEFPEVRTDQTGADATTMLPVALAPGQRRVDVEHRIAPRSTLAIVLDAYPQGYR